ncbi:bifunctional preprotein translocase subunit SecD/SecF [Metamycoplasma cloacale]|uniref:Uncharacterized protein n=1 Tax=Metamycoplasma cloacale TaxID=92401 RepID=A0A2Z4LM37_9BACT|nr:hypothetical protein [Metamycoplasma cloacale]AWX42823.1 hypothetical protein DK849_01965 [Metamycoplasma cloacale]VEU79358.1 bifunctional preprotein translocase subunit SecD/SecF [Metamycoplasma cloacale]
MKKTKGISSKFRWFISIFVIVGMILSIIFGSIFFLGPKLNKDNINSNVQASNISLKIKPTTNTNLASQDLPSSKAILNTTKSYIQNKNTLSSIDISLSSNDTVNITSYAHNDDQTKNELINSLVNKPHLTFTDENGNPVFYKGQFLSRLEPGVRKTLNDFMNGDPGDFIPKFVANPATAKNKQGVSNRITLKFSDDGWTEFIKYGYELALMIYYPQYFNNSSPKAYIWINLQEFVNIAKTQYPDEWLAAGENPVNFAYVGNSAKVQEVATGEVDEKGQPIKKEIQPVLKTDTINAAKYLITVSNPFALRTSNVNDSAIYLLNDNKNGYTDEELATAINYGVAPFEYVLQSSYFIETNSTNVNKYLVVFAILFALMSIYLIIRYRLLGFISSLTILFLTFILLVVFTILNIFITPIIGLTILISIIMAFMLIMHHMNVYRKEIMEGSNAVKSISKSTQKSLITSIDSTAILILAIFMSIFISISYSTIIALIFFTSIMISFVASSMLNTYLIRNVVKTESFENKVSWVLYKDNKFYSRIQKMNLINKSKFYTIGFAIFVVLALISFFIISGINKSVYNGLNLSSNLKNGIVYSIIPTNGIKWNLDTTHNIASIISPTISNVQGEINHHLANIKDQSYIIEISKINSSILNDLNTILSSSNIDNFKIIENHITPVNISTDIATASMVLGISTLLMFIYLMIRYSWRAALMMFIKQTFAFILVLLTALATYIEISSHIIDGLLFACLYNAIDSILFSNKIKEEFSKNLNTKNYIYSKEEIKEYFRIAINDLFGEQIMMLLIAALLMSSTTTLMTWLNPTIVLIFGINIIMIVLINLFLVPLIWMQLEIKKNINKQKRINDGYWNSQKVEEQTFIEINDYSI